MSKVLFVIRQEPTLKEVLETVRCLARRPTVKKLTIHMEQKAQVSSNLILAVKLYGCTMALVCVMPLTADSLGRRPNQSGLHRTEPTWS
ncbi:hypothetical protein L596_021036 [Steinernema carpocapsae]|uniref:Uncharacterized protein n=1 Tax=Steinernema carpocapsae TaxID=34508 RepID=A0A4U5MVB7_STECR|nr:hypothetical protein L596_021036 [Steinernema carpocapsae]